MRGARQKHPRAVHKAEGRTQVSKKEKGKNETIGGAPLVPAPASVPMVGK
jgi:hypothetical protein